MKRNYMKSYYYFAAHKLHSKNLIPYIPELKITNAKGYLGQIVIEKGKATKISLSKWNLYVNPCLIEQEDIDEILETIAHEFAHMFFVDHSDNHKEMTQAMYDYITAELELAGLEAIA